MMGKKTDQLRDKSQSELTKFLADKRQKLIDLRMEQVTLKLKNSQRISQTRREIARILTLLREREIRAPIKGEDQK